MGKPCVVVYRAISIPRSRARRLRQKTFFPWKKEHPTMPATQEVAEFLTFRRKQGGFRLRVTLEGRNLNLSDRDSQLSGRSGHRVQLIDAKFDLEERQSRN